MTAQIFKVLTYALIPTGTLLGSGAWAALRPPGLKVRSALQHFAAGLVFAAVVGGILLGLVHEGRPVAAILGFAVGVALMPLVNRLTEGKEAKQTEGGLKAAGRTHFMVTLGMDIAIAGLMIGVSFATDAKAGVALIVALTVEAIFLGLSVTVALNESGSSRAKVLVACAGLASLLLASVGVGVTLLSRLSGVVLEGVLSFGCVALIYIVTEALLTEAGDETETTLHATVFLIGFIVLLVGVIAI